MHSTVVSTDLETRCQGVSCLGANNCLKPCLLWRILPKSLTSAWHANQWYFSNVNEYGNENDCYSFTKTKTMLIYQTKIIWKRHWWRPKLIKTKTLLMKSKIKRIWWTVYEEWIFSVCGLLTSGRRNRMSKSLEMRACLKLNSNVLKETGFVFWFLYTGDCCDSWT